MKPLLWVLGVASLAVCGCLTTGGSRLPAEDAQKEKDLDIRLIGDVTEVADIGQWQISGVGLVTGLDGTGDAPKGTFRNELEQQLLKQKVENVKSVLDNPNNALVLVSAFITPGCGKGDLLDVEVTLPPGSKCTSLRGGFLHETVLRNHEQARKLSPEYSGDRIIPGHVLAKAKGRLLVGLGAPDEPAELRRGRVWEGAVSIVDRPFYLAMKTDDESVRIAADVASRINFMFRDDLKKRESVLRNKHLYLLEDVTKKLNRTSDGLSRADMAKAVNKKRIHVRLPYAYRHNPERYLRVLRLMPLREEADKSGPYRKRLHDMLLDPRDTVRAALRLEALGSESVPALKKGLASEHPLVRFASAEALIYLDNMAGAEELAKLAESHSLLRMNCLTALASSEENICRQKLALLLGDRQAELRCGAFWFLRLARDSKEEDPAFRTPYLNTDVLGKVCWLHRPAPESEPLVLLSLTGRAEIALFGNEMPLRMAAPVSAGADFIVSQGAGEEICTVSRISTRSEKRQQCPATLEAVLRAMVDLGAEYPELVDVVCKLEASRALPCPVAKNLLPEAVSLERLVTEGQKLR